ncbi:MAG: ABC transporter permease subunit, partial [Candidatus Berkelbacteria bacterium]
MRYSHPLQKSRKHHILKHHLASGVISWVWILAAFLVVGFLFSFSSLDIKQVLGGFAVSLIRASIAYIIAAIIAIIIALSMTSSRWLEGLLLPVFDVLQSFPSFALFPVLVVALKNSPESIIILVLVITMVWPILFSIIGGIKNRRQDFEEAATIFGATGTKRLIHFVIPELMPSIITGSIVGWGEGWEYIIGAELLVKTNIGIGSYLGFLGQNQENVALAFGIIVLLMLLFVINKLLWLPLLTRATNYSS